MRDGVQTAMTPISSMRQWRFVRAAAPAAVVVAVLGGCVDAGRLAKENDRVRAQMLDLGKQVDRLSRRNRELEAELTRVSATPDSLPEAIRANTPHVTEIKIGRLSHAAIRTATAAPTRCSSISAPPTDSGGPSSWSVPSW